MPGRWKTTERPPGAWRADWLFAAGVMALTFGTYVATLYPGLGGGGDAAKFRFLGHVLGTAHPPGYPLYVVLSWLFSILPIGTLAYRINLMSAACAALAAGATYGSARALGARRMAGLAAGLGLGFGRAFWSKAVVAEVYALAALLIAATVWALLVWSRTGRTRWLLGAVAFASLAFGNHLSVAFAVPAFVAFALLHDARGCLRPRILAACVAIVALGISQYGFIILRTWQHAPYLESSATNLRELWDVLTARRFAGDIFAFSWHQILAERLPAFAATVARELTGAGVVLLAAGAVWMARHRRRELGLLALGFAGTAVVTIGVAADSDGFILPAFAFAWPAVGAGLEALLAFVDRTAPRRLAQAVTVPLAVALPLWLAVSNFTPNNHAHRRFEDVFFGALFEMLPDRAVIVAEEYAVDQVVLYQLLGAEAARGRDIRHVGAEPDRLRTYLEQGFDLFAFPRARKALEGHGMAFEPIQLPGPSLPDYLGTVRPGWIVAIASTPGGLDALPPPARRAALRRAGLAEAAAGPGRALAAIGVSGARAGSALVSGSGAVAVRAGVPVGQSRTVAGVDVRVSAGAGEATISVGGSEVISAATGTVLVVMAPDGRGIASARVEAARGFRVPLDMSVLPVYRAVFAGRCEELGNVGWRDVSPALGSGAVIARIDDYRAFDASMVIYAAAEDASAPRMTATAGSGQPRVGIAAYDTANPGQQATLRRRMAADGLGTTQWERPERYVLRLAIAVNDGGDYSTTTLSLGRPLPFGVARAWVDLNNPRRATLCSVQPGT